MSFLVDPVADSPHRQSSRTPPGRLVAQGSPAVRALQRGDAMCIYHSNVLRGHKMCVEGIVVDVFDLHEADFSSHHGYLTPPAPVPMCRSLIPEMVSLVVTNYETEVFILTRARRFVPALPNVSKTKAKHIRASTPDRNILKPVHQTSCWGQQPKRRRRKSQGKN